MSVETMMVSNLDSLQRKLHSYQVLLWLQRSYLLKDREEGTSRTLADGCDRDHPGAGQGIDADGRGGDGAGTDEDDRALLSKSSVYKAYLAMCRRDGLNPLFIPPVLGKMVRRAFPTVKTKRKGPRGRVKQYYIGLLPHHDGERASMPPLQAEIKREADEAEMTLLRAPYLPSSVREEVVEFGNPESAFLHRQPGRKRKRQADGLPTQENSTLRTVAHEEEQRKDVRGLQNDAQARPRACPRATTKSRQAGRRSSSTSRDPQRMRSASSSCSMPSSLPLTEIPMDAPWARIYLDAINATYRAASHPIKMEDEMVDQQLAMASPVREDSQEDDVQEAGFSGSGEWDAIVATLLPRQSDEFEPTREALEPYGKRSSEGTPEDGDVPPLQGELEDQWDWNLDLDKLEDILDSSCCLADDVGDSMALLEWSQRIIEPP